MVETLERKITVEEFRKMEFADNDFFIYELINGILMRRASPKTDHQRILRRLALAIGAFLEKNSMGEFFFAPFDVFFDDYNQAQPDILFVKNERSFIIHPTDCVTGAPDLVVEIISPGSVRQDRVDKKVLYEKFGVREYWIIDPNNRAVEIYILQNDQFAAHQLLEAEGKITSTILVGLDFDVKDLFFEKS